MECALAIEVEKGYYPFSTSIARAIDLLTDVQIVPERP